MLGLPLPGYHVYYVDPMGSVHSRLGNLMTGGQGLLTSDGSTYKDVRGVQPPASHDCARYASVCLSLLLGAWAEIHVPTMASWIS